MSEISNGAKAFGLNILSSVGGSLVTSMGTALWEHLRHRSVDWYGILALFILTCAVFFLISRMTRITPSAKSKDSPPSAAQPSRLKIISAHYGVEGINDPEVTRYLLERLHGNAFAEPIVADLFHGFDPVSGNKNKRLKVRYSFDGREATITRPEYALLILPEDPYLKEQASRIRAEETPPKKSGPPSPQELRGQALSLAGDLCALLIGYGEPLDPPPIDDGYAGLGPLPPDDLKIENAIASSFSSRISDVRSHLGERGLLGESFNFSSFGEALNGSRVRNANGVRVIIKCLGQAAKKIDERFISGVPFAFASSPSRATDLRSLKEETFQLVWELKEFYRSLSPCPGGDESLKDGTTEGLGRFAISHLGAISAWSSKIRHEYAARFSVRVTDSLHKLGSKGLDVCELEQYSKSVDTDENVSNVIEALQKLASGIEGT